MATRKQKHEAALARREKRLAEERASGLKALKDDQERRAAKKRDAAREKHDKEHSWKHIDRNCILCQDLLEAQRKGVDSG